MSPRAAWRLEALGFEHVADYGAGKVEWLAYGLPREGSKVDLPSAGELADPEPLTCGLHDSVGELAPALQRARYGQCLVINEQRIVLGRIRRSALDGVDEGARAEAVMESGPSTVRPDVPARELIERLAQKSLNTALLTTPNGCLVGVFDRRDAERALEGRAAGAA